MLNRIVLLLFIVTASSNIWSDTKVNESLLFSQTGQTFFSGRKIRLVVATPSNSQNHKTISWNIRYSGRTIAAGETPLKGKTATINFDFPKLADEVVAQAILTCVLGNEKLQTPLYFYPENPFAQKKDFLTKAKIGIWLPAGNDKFINRLGKLELPFKVVNELTSDLDVKTLIVSGLDFDAYPGLDETFETLCEKGCLIIIIPPSSGVYPVNLTKTNELTLSGNQQISVFSKKFDTMYWAGKPPASNGLTLTPYDDSIALTSNSKSNLTFFEMKIGAGKLIITTWNIIDTIDTSPTPLFLLANLIFNNNIKINEQ